MDKLKKIGYNKTYMRGSIERGGVVKYKKSVFRSLAMVTQLGLSVLTPIFLCTLAGYYIDSWLGTKFMVFLVIIGAMAGGRCAYVMAMKTLEAEKREDERERQNRPLRTDRPEVSRPKQPSRVRRETQMTEETDREEEDEQGN